MENNIERYFDKEVYRVGTENGQKHIHIDGYCYKADTLIMSARDEDGNRLATIEYNLKTGRVIQCRAACNAEPKRYNDIVSLVKRSMELKSIKYAA